jgi:hypothetical protein
MFHWYGRAKSCYAYLYNADFLAEEAQLKKSGWFKRGRALQELIAPPKLLFLASNFRQYLEEMSCCAPYAALPA